YQTKDQQLLIHRPSECIGPPFIYEIAEIYRSEPERQQVFNKKIRKLFGEELKVIHLDDNSSNDGVLECNVHSKSVLRLLVEMKNEIGTGAVYVEKPIIDPLTDFIPLIPTNDRAHTERVAQLFKALYLGVNKLTEYYRSLDVPTDPRNSQRFFPYPNQYEQQNTIVEFTYERKLVDQPNKLLWKAITKTGGKLLLNSHGITIKGHTNFMDYVEAKQLYECDSLSHDEYKAVFKDIKEAIDKLHKENIVFADLCDSNILVNKSQGQYRGILIDFDWAGEGEVARYPSFMNHKYINWPPGAEDRKKLSRKHDVYWLELLKSKYLGESVEKTKLRQELKARTDELEETISHYSVEIGKLNAIIVELEKNKTVTAKLESENAEFRDRITKVEQRQMLSDNVSKVTNSSNNSSSNFNLLADQLPMEMDTSLPEESIPEGLPEPAVNIPVMDQSEVTTFHAFNSKDKVSISSDSSPENDQDLKLPEVEVNISTEDTEDKDDNKESSDDDNSENEGSFNNNEDDGG
ncbi:17246_t:CDS:2, partial [Racocetra persica]